MNRVSRAAGKFVGFKQCQKSVMRKAMRATERIVSMVSRMRAGQAGEWKKLFGIAALVFYLITVAFFVRISAENWQGRDWFGVNFLPQAQEGVGSLTFRWPELMPARK